MTPWNVYPASSVSYTHLDVYKRQAIENGETLTAEWMCQQYEDLNAQDYGPAVEKDDVIRYEWARIPHFYNAFYVYKYATGYSAATAISKKILACLLYTSRCV